jgi:plastocyanin
LTTQIRIAASLRDHLCKALLAAALVAAPAAFAQSTDQSASPPAGHEYTVAMSSMNYAATPSGLKVGDTIVWVNHDTVMHSVTARDHSFDLRLNPGQSAKLTLSKAGRIPFYCLYHPSMRGALDVAAQ